MEKNIREARWLLAGCALLMFAFQWLRVWLVSQALLEQLKLIPNLLPKLEKLLPVPFHQVATRWGGSRPLTMEPLVILIVTVWAIARGLDAVSGEIGRGTMEMLVPGAAGAPIECAIHPGRGDDRGRGGHCVCRLVWCRGRSEFDRSGRAAVGQPVSALHRQPCFRWGPRCGHVGVELGDRYRWRTIGVVYAFTPEWRDQGHRTRFTQDALV